MTEHFFLTFYISFSTQGDKKSGNQNYGGFSSPSQRECKSKRSSSVITAEELRMGILKNNDEVIEKYYSIGK